MGVYSLSTRRPLKHTGFESPNEVLNVLDTRPSAPYSYRDWQFTFVVRR